MMLLLILLLLLLCAEWQKQFTAVCLLPKKALLSQVAQPSLCRVRVAALTATVSLGVDQLTEAGRGTAALAPHRRSSPVRRSNGQLDRRRISAAGPISPLTLIEKNRKEICQFC